MVLHTAGHQYDAEEAEACVRSLHDSDDSSDAEARVVQRRKFAKRAGGLALVAAAIVGTMMVMNGGSGLPSPTSAQHLMHSQEFRNVVQQRVLLSASQNGRSLNMDEVQVGKAISEELHTVLTRIEQHFPEVTEKLKASELSEEKKQALLTLVSRQHDARLKVLGEKAIRVVLTNALYGEKTIRGELDKEFRPEMPELMAMYKEIVPASIREAKAKWYAKQREQRAQAEDNGMDDGAWGYLMHPKSMSIMKTFFDSNTGNMTAGTQSAAARLLSTGLEKPLNTKLGVGITGFVVDAVNLLVIELSQLLQFKMPWWGWLLSLLPSVSLGTTSCIIAPIEKSYSDFWCVDFLVSVGFALLEVMVNGVWTFVTQPQR